MKIDLLSQAVLIVAIVLLACFASGLAPTNTMLVVLGIWQLASAFHLILCVQPYQTTELRENEHRAGRQPPHLDAFCGRPRLPPSSWRRHLVFFPNYF